jgi:hypothetical protein
MYEKGRHREARHLDPSVLLIIIKTVQSMYSKTWIQIRCHLACLSVPFNATSPVSLLLPMSSGEVIPVKLDKAELSLTYGRFFALRPWRKGDDMMIVSISTSHYECMHEYTCDTHIEDVYPQCTRRLLLQRLELRGLFLSNWKIYTYIDAVCGASWLLLSLPRELPAI